MIMKRIILLTVVSFAAIIAGGTEFSLLPLKGGGRYDRVSEPEF